MKYRHREAFALMHYACDCGHAEVVWNSRDGVTPFGFDCPSCGEPSLTHVNWNADRCAPNHKPHFGQRVFCDMTRERAEAIARLRVASRYPPGAEADAIIKAVTESIYHDGTAPAIRIEGFRR